MAAANFVVVITNGGRGGGARSLEQPISTNSVPRAFFPRFAIGCRLLGGVLIGGYMRWYSVNRRYGIYGTIYRSVNGSEFQSVGPETAKHLWPYLVVLARGTARSPWAAERRWPRLADSDTGEHSSARCVGTAWCRHLYTRLSNLSLTYSLRHLAVRMRSQRW